MFSRNRILLFFIIIFSCVSNSFAEEFFYRSDKYQCPESRSDNKTWVMWARFIPQGDDIDVMFYWNPTDDATEFKVKKSDIKNGTASIKHYKIHNIENIWKGKPLVIDTGCTEKPTLMPVKNTMVNLLQDIIDTLNKRPITSNQYVLSIQKWWKLPPESWLPELDQKTIKTNYNNAWIKLYDDYPEAMRKQFQQPNISEKEAKQIVNDMMATIEQVISTYNDDDYKYKLLNVLDDMTLYWAFLHRNNPEQAKIFAVKSADELCKMASMPRRINSQTDLRWITKLPQPLWSRAYAEKVLQWARSCKKNDDKIIRTLKNEWQDIEKMVQSYPQFIEILNKKLSQPINIQALKTQQLSNKFIDEEREGFYISKVLREFTEQHFIKPYLLSSVPNVAENLASVGKQQLSENKLTITQLGHFCSKQAENITYRELRTQIIKGCDNLLVQEIVNIGNTVPAEVEKQLEMLPQNIEGIEKLEQLTQQLRLEPRYYYSDIFKKAFTDLQKSYQPVWDAIDSKYQEMDTVMSANLSKEYQPFLDEDDLDVINTKIKELANKYEQFSQIDYDVIKHLDTYNATLSNLQDKLSDKAKELTCNKVWNESEFPSDYADKQINDGYFKNSSLKEAFCDMERGFKEREATFGVKVSGVFSKTYSFFLTYQSDTNKEVTISIDLLEDDGNDNILNLDNFQTSVGKPNIQAIEKYKQRNRLMGCFKYPNVCVTQ
ncbi:hypothetical protein [Phocoenobacter skyensis]|uniref:Uncharacterized protein n=1 Tax=Phocoenobacter skyensis TaxID=97481 RepID=A0A1H7Y7X0_9PAST|nr:hypothetical protein [Pasteurella skyensis]MDP8079964.1 hypothetical protein [Pasteurella skyensis]MDP8085860.1 hypothetical protein [Pasteurella skyensis]MDP8185696.1 hypothetical protein [Pasteurella skyensis]QLB22319.1 hypothetical protein A6B44_03525 [Pasteurella skyensis]SEM41427.1 hypothetical protein SAMN05444853_11650 [Pasteurella skyensis]